MKFFKFDEKSFPKFSIVYANNEAEALKVYRKSYEYAGYNVPKVIDIDEIYNFIARHSILKCGSETYFVKDTESFFTDAILACCKSNSANIFM